MNSIKVFIFALALIVAQASEEDWLDSRSRRGKVDREYNPDHVDSAVSPSARDSEKQAKNILDQITKLNSQIEKKTEKSLEGGKVVIEKSHPVEVHTVEDHPEERLFREEDLIDDDEDSLENGEFRSGTNESVPDSWVPLEPNTFFPFGKMGLARQNNCTWKEYTSSDVVDDEVIQCQKINDRKCYSSQETFFETYTTEVCDETYTKNCHISFEEDNSIVPVEVCYTETRRVCDNRKRQLGFGEYSSVNETCLHVFETVCESYKTTRIVSDDYADCEVKSLELCERTGKCPKVPQTTCQIVTKNVTKEIPESKCRKIAKTICGPEDCPVRVMPELCRNETKRTTSKIPVETCSLTPKRECKDVSVLVPSLVPTEKCIDIPKEVCASIVVPRNITRTASRLSCDNQAATDDEN